jgi:hypothetical protein
VSDEMELAYRQDDLTRERADAAVRAIDAFLRDGYEVGDKTRALAWQAREKLAALSAHIVAVWD